jgi:hypothetical protein
MSLGIDSSMLAAMREAIEDLLPDVANILTVTNAADGQGGVTQTWATSCANVRFRLDMESGSEPISGGGVSVPFTRYKGSLPYDTTIASGNRIQHLGITYAVTSINTSQSWQAVLRVDLEKV